MAVKAVSETRQVDRLSPECVADARLVLADLDGCLVSEGRAFPEAPAFVAACRDRLWIVSNNSTHTAAALSAELAHLGLHIAAGRILLAGEQTLCHMRACWPDKSVALYASAQLQAQARALGLCIDMADPDIVILCRDLTIALPELERVTRHCLGGAPLWVSNTDCAHPGLDGHPVPETGALLAALRAVMGAVMSVAHGDLPYDCIGKPHAHMAQMALMAADIPAQDTVFVGDNAATDGALAHAAGIPFVHLVRGRAA